MQLVAAHTFTCGISFDESLQCWGSFAGTVPCLYRQISSGSEAFFVCGVMTNGKINCGGKIVLIFKFELK